MGRGSKVNQERNERNLTNHQEQQQQRQQPFTAQFDIRYLTLYPLLILILS